VGSKGWTEIEGSRKTREGLGKLGKDPGRTREGPGKDPGKPGKDPANCSQYSNARNQRGRACNKLFANYLQSICKLFANYLQSAKTWYTH
jgi:hypothetical protein